MVGADPAELEAAGYRRVGRDFPVFLHPQTGEEYALARTERKSGHGYHGFEVHAGPEVTLEQDLARRDLTINAMARAPDGSLVDPYDGRADLDARILRHVSPAFVEDPLRVLRVARFAARFAPLGFTIAPETRALMRAMAADGELDWLVPERVWQETARALDEPAPGRFFEELADCEALARVLPELTPLFDAGLTGHDGDVAARRALDAAVEAGAEGRIRLAALVHSLDPDGALDRFCDRLRVPRRWADLAICTARWQRACRGLDLDTPGDAWPILRGLDVLRRPERFAEVLSACDAIAAGRADPDWPGRRHALERAHAAAAAVDGAALARAGWRGAELGRELDRRRAAAVEAALDRHQG